MDRRDHDLVPQPMPALPDASAATSPRRSAVLGASGFIGDWVARAAMARGDTVLLVARDPSALRDRWTAPRVGAGDVALAMGDATRVATIERALRDFGADRVFNLAGYGVDRTERDEALARAVNADFPAELARLAITLGFRLVHAGSALEYGTASGNLHEGTPPMPTTQYGITKLAGTEGVRAVARARGAFAITARLFTVFGPGEHAGRLLPTLWDASRRTGAIPLTAGGQRRDFTYVEDVAEGMLRLAESGAAPGEAVNLATGALHTVRAFVEVAAGVLGIAPERLAFGALPTRAEEMAHAPVSIARLRALVGWSPDASLAHGVARAVARLRAAR